MSTGGDRPDMDSGTRTGTGTGTGTGVDTTTGTVDFFVTYTGADARWAEWIAWVVEDAGYRVVSQVWDFGAGSHFVAEMHRAARAAARTVAVLSAAYASSAYAEAAWQATWAADSSGRARKLLVARVEDCGRPGLWAEVVGVDLFGLDREAARARLLAVARGERGESASEPDYPGYPSCSGVWSRGPKTEPAFPGRWPAVWNVPRRLATFTGRETLLEQIHSRLSGGGAAAVVQAAALHGLGGVGKTQLAIEFAHRNATAYDLVWWVEAEQATLVAERLAALAGRVGLTLTGRIPDDAAAALDWLGRHGAWLLIFDNVPAAEDIHPWLPGGTGHTLITSRNPSWGQSWGQLARTVAVDVLGRAEAVALLRRRVPAIDDDDAEVAEALAAEVGDLPLALEQAAAYLEQTGLPAVTYLHRFRTRRSRMLAGGQDLAYGASVDTAWSLALDRLRTRSPAAVTLLDLCAHLGPEPIPLALFADHPDLLDPPLRLIVAGADPATDLNDIVGAVVAYSLTRRNGDTIELHRLVAAVIRAHQPPDRHAAGAATVRALLATHRLGNPRDPAIWPQWAALAPHVLTAPALHPDDPATDIGQNARWLLLTTAVYLEARGDFRAAGALGRTLHSRWVAALGADHPDSIAAAYTVAAAHRAIGDHQAARALDEDIHTWCQRLYGDDHPATLASANNLARDLRALGDHQSARTLDEDTLTRRRITLGDDHPDTLTSANNLACDLRRLGDFQAARTLDEDTLTRSRRILGDDHPDTRRSASNLAVDLRQLGDLDCAE